MARVLVVDDESGVRFALEEVLREHGHEVKSAAGVEPALELFQGVDLIITDLIMPGQSGLDLLRKVHEQDPELPMIMLTARGSERIAVEAMKAGAYDYLTKPFDIAELALAVERGAEARRLRTDARRHRAEQRLGGGIVGESGAIRHVIELVERVAGKDVPVLLRGETGTGKELVGGLLHALSRRTAKPLVRFNCAAIPAALAEAELFGHTRGAFTGATGARSGFFAQADGGTLILDEVAELPSSVQPSCCERWHRARSSPSVPAAPNASTCASWPVRIATWRRRRAPNASGRIFTTGWPSSRSSCRHCAAGAKTFRCSPRSSSGATPLVSVWTTSGSPPPCSTSSAGAIGPATCASSKMWWPAWSL